MTKPGNGAPQPRRKLSRLSGLLWTGIGIVLFCTGGLLALDNLTRNPPHFYVGLGLSGIGAVLALGPSIRRRDRPTPRPRPNGNGA